MCNIFEPNEVVHICRYTTSNNATSVGTPSIYAILLQWPSTSSNSFTLGSPIPTANSEVYLLGLSDKLNYTVVQGGGIDVQVPGTVLTDVSLKRGNWTCEFAFAFKLIGFK